MPSVVDAKGASAHLILNRAADNAAALLESQGGRDTRRPRGTVALPGGSRSTARA